MTYRRFPMDRARDAEQRLLDGVVRNPETGCWEWQHAAFGGGYGVLTLGQNRKYYTHRIAYAVFNGEPGDLMVRHVCHNRKCVNPTHLLRGTAADNARDREAAGRRPRGSLLRTAKLTESDVPVIRRRLASGEPVRAIARDYGVSQCPIQRIKHGRGWKHVA